MIEATLRVWLTATTDEEADAAINAMSKAAQKRLQVVLFEQSRRSLDDR